MRRVVRVLGAASVLAVILTLLSHVGPMPVATAISSGCTEFNDAGWDSAYVTHTRVASLSFSAGEVITITAGEPFGAPTPATFSLFFDLTQVAIRTFPGTITYTVPANITVSSVAVSANVGAGSATFTASCAAPVPTVFFSANGQRGQLFVTVYAEGSIALLECYDSRPGMQLTGSGLQPNVFRLSYAGAGWHDLECFMTTTALQFADVAAGMLVLAPPYSFTIQQQIPPLGLEFPFIAPPSCEEKALILKNDGTQPYNINQITFIGGSVANFSIVSGAGQGSIPPGGARFIVVRACSATFSPFSTVLLINGSTGAGAGTPAPIRIPVNVNTGE